MFVFSFPFHTFRFILFYFLCVSRFCSAFSVRSILVFSLSRVSLKESYRFVHLRHQYVVTTFGSLWVSFCATIDESVKSISRGHTRHSNFRLHNRAKAPEPAFHRSFRSIFYRKTTLSRCRLRCRESTTRRSYSMSGARR